jgi:hypothetical protein
LTQEELRKLAEAGYISKEALVSQMMNLAKAGKNVFTQAAGKAGGGLGGAWAGTKATGKMMKPVVTRAIQRNPLAAAGVAGGAGYLAG